ncbi:hypothetical protein BRC81_06625 [Halobacteriales archaeon QS_1_68_20]|nr:MAG: hypothetical protein BRC81_06625 [Halobacteriales archaeon QS_1_68_20]
MQGFPVVTGVQYVLRVYSGSADHDAADAHFLDNVASLCVECQRKADAGRISGQRLRAARQ